MSSDDLASPVPPPDPVTEATGQLWGSDDLEGAFTSDKRVVPWRSAPRQKHKPLIGQADLERLLTGAPALADVDPRHLYATQTWVVASHVAYYRTRTWETTGTTSADRGQPANRYPLIWVDERGRHIILGGHHRSFAALLGGRTVRARVLRPNGDDSTAVLPLLLAGTATALGHRATTDPVAAADLIRNGETVLVPDLAVAEATLEVLGLDPEVVADRLAMAATGRCLVSE